MNLLFDSFWRALAYCLRPRVIALSFLPLLLMVGLALGLGYLYWDMVLETVRLWVESSTLINTLSEWLHGVGLGGL
ncbi:MAG: hypothetical protein KAX57_10755, partial [Rhodoferax sp.]|nr:hypothetical protein [Rhodoferax sp.]